MTDPFSGINRITPSYPARPVDKDRKRRERKKEEREKPDRDARENDRDGDKPTIDEMV